MYFPYLDGYILESPKKWFPTISVGASTPPPPPPIDLESTQLDYISNTKFLRLVSHCPSGKHNITQLMVLRFHLPNLASSPHFTHVWIEWTEEVLYSSLAIAYCYQRQGEALQGWLEHDTEMHLQTLAVSLALHLWCPWGMESGTVRRQATLKMI